MLIVKIMINNHIYNLSHINIKQRKSTLLSFHSTEISHFLLPFSLLCFIFEAFPHF